MKLGKSLNLYVAHATPQDLSTGCLVNKHLLTTYYVSSTVLSYKETQNHIYDITEGLRSVSVKGIPNKEFLRLTKSQILQDFQITK